MQYLIDRFEEHRIAVGVEIAEHFRVRQQSARRNTEDETAIEHVIEHRDLRRDGGRMAVRHVHGAGAKLDRFGAVDQACKEHQARRDVLGLIGDVLAGISLNKAEFVGKYKSLAVFAQRLSPILVERMDRHGEEAEFHL